MGDRGVEPNEVLCCSHQLGSEVDQFVRQAQMGLAARGTMTARIFDAISLMNDHTRLPSITLATSPSSCRRARIVYVLLPISSSASTYGLTVSGVIRVPDV